MTTPHNSAVPRRKNPLHSSSHCKNFVAASLDKLVTTLDVSNRRRSRPSHKFVLSQSALYALLHTLLSSMFPPNRLYWQPFLGMPSSICFSIFRRLVRSSSQLSWCDTHARRMVLRLVPSATLPSSLAFWPSLDSETRCRGCPSYTAQSRVPSAFAVRLSRGLVVQLRVRQQAANNRSLGSVRRTGRSLRSGGAYDSRAARQGNQESDTQFTDRNNVTVYSVL